MTDQESNPKTSDTPVSSGEEKKTGTTRRPRAPRSSYQKAMLAKKTEILNSDSEPTTTEKPAQKPARKTRTKPTTKKPKEAEASKTTKPEKPVASKKSTSATKSPKSTTASRSTKSAKLTKSTGKTGSTKTTTPAKTTKKSRSAKPTKDTKPAPDTKVTKVTKDTKDTKDTKKTIETIETKTIQTDAPAKSGKRMIRISRSVNRENSRSDSGKTSKTGGPRGSRSSGGSRKTSRASGVRIDRGISESSTRRSSHKEPRSVSRRNPSIKIQGYRHNYGLLLLNMGGPESKKMIGDYIYRLLSDPLVMRVPSPFRNVLARMISIMRRGKAAARYQLIGGKSPLKQETEAQVNQLEKVLGIPVTYAMRYTEPFVKTGHKILVERDVNRLIVLPLYPQYCHATTMSALKDFQEHRGGDQPYRIIEHHYDYAPYIYSMSGLLAKSLQRREVDLKTAVVFAAHSIPQKHVQSGDPYVGHIEATVESIVSKSSLPCDYALAFQSRLGPVKWQGPTMEEILEELISRDIQQLVVQPVSFVSENLETLYDLDIEFKDKCMKAGIKNYIRVPTPGTRPSFMEAIASLVKREIECWEVPNAPHL